MCSSPKSSSARPKQRKRVVEPVLSADEYSAMVDHASMCYEQAVMRRAEKRRLLAEQAAALNSLPVIQHTKPERWNFFAQIAKAIRSVLTTPMRVSVSK